MYGLAEDDTAVLQSEDNEFYGNHGLDHCAPGTSLENRVSDGEEIDQRVFKDATEIQSRISRAGQCSSNDIDEPSTSTVLVLCAKRGENGFLHILSSNLVMLSS